MAFWDRITSRGDVEDRRGMAPATVGGIGAAGLMLLFLANVLLGNPVDMGSVLGTLESLNGTGLQRIEGNPYEGADAYEEFAAKVLGSANDMWGAYFSSRGAGYEAPRLVLFRDATRSGCGIATSDVGPHYCPIDRTIYLDETFFDELTRRFGAAGGDVAEAYVIAHEAGHHAQLLLGLLGSDAQVSNDDSVRTELMADCFAGLWAHSVKAQGVLEPDEIREALDAAAAVGDDRIQQRVTGQVRPETWTHGSSADRVRWFTAGYETGRPDACIPQ